jgi:hypothetical protein
MQPDLHKFKELYKDAFGVELTAEHAEVKARVLMNLYKAVYGSPVIQKDYGNKNNTKH